MIDQGANGSVSGSDLHEIAYVDGYTADVGGLDGHQINNIPIAAVGAVMQDQTGEFITIINQVACYGKGAYLPLLLSSRVLWSPSFMSAPFVLAAANVSKAQTVISCHSMSSITLLTLPSKAIVTKNGFPFCTGTLLRTHVHPTISILL